MPRGIYKRKSAIQRFWEKVDKSGDCWEWIGCKNEDGYGTFWFSGKSWYAHRFSWVLHKGFIPEGLFVCHHCDNPRCVNPNHLFLGTNSDNMLDSYKKGRNTPPDNRGEKNGMSKRTEREVLAIQAEYDVMEKKNQSKLARKHKLSRSQINQIVHRKAWRNI